MRHVHVILGWRDSEAVGYKLQVLTILWFRIELELGLRQVLVPNLFRLHLSNAKALVDTVRHSQSGINAGRYDLAISHAPMTAWEKVLQEPLSELLVFLCERIHLSVSTLGLGNCPRTRWCRRLD